MNFFKSILSGFLIGVGGCTYLSINPLLGAFLFSLGLLTILNFSLPLYTGRIGFLFDKSEDKLISKILKLVTIWIGNLIGTLIAATLFLSTRIGSQLVEVANPIVETKMNDSFISLFILGIGCGALMHIAASGYKTYAYRQKGAEFTGNLFAIVPVAVFILCGFEHCIADMFYMFLCEQFDIVRILIITAGNSVGSLLMNFIRK